MFGKMKTHFFITPLRHASHNQLGMTKKEIDQNLNEDNMKLQIARLQHRLEKIKLGGGEKRIAQQHAQGKMSVRERVNYLIDPGSSFLEIGAFAGY